MAGLKEVAKNAGVPVDAAKSLFAAIGTMLGNGEKSVKIPGFGSFQLKEIKGRTLASPVIQGGEPITIEDCLGVKFTLAPATKHRINVMVSKRKRQAADNERILANPPKRPMKPAAAKRK